MTLLYGPSRGDVNTRGPEGGAGSQVENGRIRRGSNVVLEHLYSFVGLEERKGSYVDSRVASIK